MGSSCCVLFRDASNRYACILLLLLLCGETSGEKTGEKILIPANRRYFSRQSESEKNVMSLIAKDNIHFRTCVRY